jgi:hypothetical protein
VVSQGRRVGRPGRRSRAGQTEPGAITTRRCTPARCQAGAVRALTPCPASGGILAGRSRESQ